MSALLLSVLLRLPIPVSAFTPPRSSSRPRRVRRLRGDAGQATPEYALVIMGATALALLFIAWATRTDRIGDLFDFVMDEVMGRAK